MKAFKAFIKPFEAPQRSENKTFNLIFISIQLSEMHGSLRVKGSEVFFGSSSVSCVLFPQMLEVKQSNLSEPNQKWHCCQVELIVLQLRRSIKKSDKIYKEEDSNIVILLANPSKMLLCRRLNLKCVN